ncbi:MarR family winged helix-turn-helix transcriptional regulator [Macrococcus bovicus]|uniref:MarR family transcriptional regulator n=1 Tax=Macrococcus bovicus TaxID=69968 RepID=A0A4R6BY15_9STAP|nr:MarR family transcriptional regulator [Macrococcus bovicus]TDM12963.1 MarR family transcriptional regulator [Macrococcus bovicus]WJP98108.1 MarR family transcriptional regulator [Macrococcus bovicus]
MDTTVERHSAVHAMIVFQLANRTLEKNVGKSIREAGLTLSQFGVLDVLYCKGEMPICNLMEKVLGTAGNMTVILKNMERDGLVCRNVSPDDKRKSVIGLTAEGRKKFEQVLPAHRSEIDEAFDVLSAEERSQLITILKKFKNKN